jgi:hypothetical protein
MNSNNFPLLTILALVIIFIYLAGQDKKEGYSMGALTQLFAKGPQDTYLTGDAWKYIPPYYYNYGWAPFYMPTRFGKMNYYYYRPYGLFY